MLKPAPAILFSILSLTLITGMCPEAAFAEAVDEAQQPVVEGAATAGGSVADEEVPIEDTSEEQPAEDVIQSEGPSNDGADAPSDRTAADEGEAGNGSSEAPAENADAAEAVTPTEGIATEAAATEGETHEQSADEVAAQAVTYAHTATAEQSGVTFTVGWDDAPAGAATTFHVTQTGGSSAAKARMDVPTYWDTNGSQESACDPTRSQWGSYYELGADGRDFTFELTARAPTASTSTSWTRKAASGTCAPRPWSRSTTRPGRRSRRLSTARWPSATPRRAAPSMTWPSGCTTGRSTSSTRPFAQLVLRRERPYARAGNLRELPAHLREAPERRRHSQRPRGG